MFMKRLMWLVLPILLGACKGGVTKDTGASERVIGDLVGSLLDGQDVPVQDAWIIVDDGTDLFTARTAGDGSFSIPALPFEDPLSLSFVASGYSAYTYQGLILSELPDAVFHVSPRDESGLYGYMTVQGTVAGAPRGSFVLVYDEYVYLGYVPVKDEKSALFEFTVGISDTDGVHHLSFLGINADATQLHGIAYTQIPEAEGGVEVVEVILESKLPQLSITSRIPFLDGEPFSFIPPQYCSSMGGTQPSVYVNASTGISMDCELTVDQYRLDVQWLPVQGQPNQAIISAWEEDSERFTYSYASLPVDAGETSVDAELLDSPVIEGPAVFAPGTEFTWSPVEGANRDFAYVLEDDQVSWYFFPYDGQRLAFPRLPEGFDTSIIGQGGTLYIRSDYLAWDTKTNEIDLTEPFRTGMTEAGDLSFVTGQ